MDHNQASKLRRIGSLVRKQLQGIKKHRLVSANLRFNMAVSEEVEIEVSGKLYNIYTIKIPYFASYFDCQCHSGQTSKKDDNIPFFKAAYQGAEKGLRHCFRNQAPDITAYHFV